MSLPDTAEYWQDVKSREPYTGRNFYHIPGANCGHRHLFEAKKLGDVNCFACLELIAQGYEHGLEEGKTDFRSKSQKKRDRKEELARIEREKFGKCTCGHCRVKRKNKITGQFFLGCSNYPKCKITSSY